MKQPFLYATTLCLYVMLPQNAFSQDILWERSLGGKHADYLMDAQATADYGFILAGSSLSGKSGTKTDANKGSLDYCLWKLKENGEPEWQKSFGGTGTDLLHSVALTNDGGFVLGGISSSNKGVDKKEDGRGQDDYWIIKLDAFGIEEWQATLGGDSQEKLHSIKPTRDGGYILGGSSSSGKSGDKADKGFGSLDYWVVRLDNKGKLVWQKTFGGKNVDELRSIATTSDGGYIVGGSSNSPASGNKTADSRGGDYWVLKLDTNGEIQWQKTLGGDKDDQLYAVLQTYDKGFILGGNSNSETSQSKFKSNQEGTDFWVVKLDAKGEMIWQETYNYANYDILASIIENPDHTLLIGGFAKGEINAKKLGSAKAKKGTDDYIALKVTESGQEIWSESVGSDGEDILRKVIETRDGGYVFAGTSNPQAMPVNPGGRQGGIPGANGALSGVSFSNGEIGALQDAKKDINRQITDTQDQANQKVKDYASTGTDAVRKGAGLDKDSPLKLGVNDAASPLSLGKVGDGKDVNPLSGLNPGSGGSPLPRSGDKKKSFGNNDFWVVKLHDRSKPKPEQPGIEAFPNPSEAQTNVIIGYEYQSGTATVVDLAGRTLQTHELSGSRTVPVDLSPYPEGIYIVNIRTNVQTDGIKVMRKGNKN